MINQEEYLEIVENTYLIDRDGIFSEGSTDYAFTQDGAPAHTANKVQDWRIAKFPNFRDKKSWPPTSPDLNPSDYFAWRFLQEVNKMGPQDLDSLKFAIRTCARKLPMDMVRRAVDNFYKRCCLCVLAEGRHFKHMMKRKDIPLLEYDLVEANPIDSAEIDALEVQREDWEGEGAADESDEESNKE